VKRILLISLVLALVFTLAVPSMVMAKDPTGPVDTKSPQWTNMWNEYLDNIYQQQAQNNEQGEKGKNNKYNEEFAAEGVFTYIDEGDVEEIGDTGKWKVENRTLEGVFVSCTDENMGDSFVITYGGIFELATQEGKLKGILESGDVTMNISGYVEPYEFDYYYEIEGYGTVPVYELAINGTWKYAEGGKGKGKFEATMDFIPTEDGHVYAVMPTSTFVMTGK